MPCGRSKSFNKISDFILAHLAMAVGPLAPASTAMIAMTTTLSSGCSKFTDDRGSSNCLKCRKTSFTPVTTVATIGVLPVPLTETGNTTTMVYHFTRESASHPKLPKLLRVRAGPGVGGTRNLPAVVDGDCIERAEIGHGVLHAAPGVSRNDRQ